MLVVNQDLVSIDLNQVAEIIKTQDTQETVISVDSIFGSCDGFYTQPFYNLVQGNLFTDLSGNVVNLNLNLLLQKFYAKVIDDSWFTINVDFLATYVIAFDQASETVSVIKNENRVYAPDVFVMKYYNKKPVIIAEGSFKTNVEYKISALTDSALNSVLADQNSVVSGNEAENYKMVEEYLQHPKTIKCLVDAIAIIKQQQQD